jgi:hypothetical protein
MDWIVVCLVTPRQRAIVRAVILGVALTAVISIEVWRYYKTGQMSYVLLGVAVLLLLMLTMSKESWPGKKNP